MIKIAPSLLAADYARLGEEAVRAEKAGADMLHMDVMDGQYVEDLSFGPGVIKAVRNHVSLPFDTHVMARDPEWMLQHLKDAGVSIVTVQAEAVTHLQRILRQIRCLGMRPGVALNPSTPLTAVEWVLDDMELLLVMTVNPGMGGQKMLPAMIRKVAAAKEMLISAGREDMLLQVDGGVDKDTIGNLYRAGADTFVAGTSVFLAGNIQQAIAELRSACAG